MSSDTRPLLRLGHSPDPDDAFMWWPLWGLGEEGPRIDTGDFRYEPVALDIEALNARSETADLEITAMSCAQYPRVSDRYGITSCGSSMGDGYGPRLVASRPMTVADLKGQRIAIPGTRTSAFGALTLMVGGGRFDYDVCPFETIIDEVVSDRFDAGLVIHEGQLTFGESGLHLIADLGQWWSEQNQLPLPLGLNTVQLQLEQRHGPGTLGQITATLLRSVQYAMDHREESIRYALGFARDLEVSKADQFIEMYVNHLTLDFGETGRKAVERFLEQLHRADLVPACDPVLIEPAGHLLG